MSRGDTDPAALAVNGLTYQARASAGGPALVSNISFTVGRREIIALVGPNGAGKTTIVRLIAGLLRPTCGDVLIDGRPLHALTHAQRSRLIAYVGQSDEPDGRLSVAQYVGLGRLPHSTLFAGNAASDHAFHALEAVGLQRLATRRMDRLSGGERQKAKIARAVCQEPSLLILDEPTNHLDPSARGELLGLVAAMGIPVVVALHDLTLIDAFAHKVAVIDGGRLCAFGPPREALSQERVRRVFDVDLFRFRHPGGQRTIPALDVAITGTGASRLTDLHA